MAEREPKKDNTNPEPRWHLVVGDAARRRHEGSHQHEFPMSDLAREALASRARRRARDRRMILGAIAALLAVLVLGSLLFSDG